MNLKRIKELVKEAGGEFWQRMESDGVVNPEAFVTFDPPQSLEKFAELILQDCITLCNNRAHAGTQGSVSDGALLCANDIKEQFGVEE